MRIKVRFAGDAVLLGVCGDVDAASAPQLLTAILGAAQGTQSEVVVDLGAVTSVDDAGAEDLHHAGRVLGRVPSDCTGQLVRLQLQHASNEVLEQLTTVAGSAGN